MANDEGGYTTPEAGAESAGFKRPDKPRDSRADVEEERKRRAPKDKSWPPKNMETKVPRADGRK